MIRKISVFVFTFLFLFCSCSNHSKIPVEKQEFHMGTVITQKVYGRNAEKVAQQVMNKIAELEAKMTINAPGSEIDKLNEMAGAGSVTLSSDSIYVLEAAKKFGEIGNGALDVTIGPLVKAWGVFTDHPRVPSGDEIKSLLSLVDYRDISIDKASSTAKLARKGQIVDLGGIAKGYAGDEAIRIYKENGISSAFVNLGGNVVVLGGKPDGSPWSIGIRNPRDENGRYIGILKVKDKAVVTSGDYERYFEKDGKRYHHIIDPKTGYPADSGLISVTIVTDKSIDADALSKPAFISGLEKGMKLIESLEGVEAIFITSDKKIYVTSGLRDIFTFDDESKEFEYVEKR